MPCPTIELQREYQRKSVAKNRAVAVEQFGGKCCKCGSTDRLEFDHIDRDKKEFHISTMWSWKKIRRDSELSKCQLLCHDCHRLKTSHERAAHLTHGTRGMYGKGCRCSFCTFVQNESVYAWRKKVGGRKAPQRTAAGSPGGGSVP